MHDDHGHHEHCCGHGHGSEFSGTCCQGSAEASPNVDPVTDIASRLRFMSAHSRRHIQALVALSERLDRELGDRASAQQIMTAVSDFETGCMRISAVVSAMNIPVPEGNKGEY